MTPPLTPLDILNDHELTALEQSSGDDCDMAAVRCVVRELRHHRSRLSAEDVEALRWLRETFVHHYGDDDINSEIEALRLRALAVLARLTKDQTP